MGCVTQKVHQTTSSNIYSEIRPLMISRKQFSYLGLTENDISEIYLSFSKIDVDCSFEITLEELLVFIKSEMTPFVVSIFKCFDLNHNQKIDVKEFVFALWNYCTLNHSRLCEFIFDLYDRDGSGILDKIELTNMLRDSYGPTFETNSNVRK
jgi:Ca2+-binding EF-hand superfamily protein